MKFKLLGTGIAALATARNLVHRPGGRYSAARLQGQVRSVVAYYNWTGFYLGINGGYAWGKSDWDLAGVNLLSSKPSGGMIGGTLGYNYQIGSVVLGFEGDFDWAEHQVERHLRCRLHLRDQEPLSRHRPRPARLRLRSLAALRHRRRRLRRRQGRHSGPAVALSASKDKVGWTAGGGLEYAFLGNWSAKIEYLYVDLGSFDTGFAAPLRGEPMSAFKENVVRAGLNYKFSGPIFSRF